jgi:PAS domain S-box-containing protein
MNAQTAAAKSNEDRGTTKQPERLVSGVDGSVDIGGNLVSGKSATNAPPLLELGWIYDTAPIGLACLSTDCRYLQVNQRLTEICGISVADHIGRSVRETVPQVADQVEQIVHTILQEGEPITGVEVNGQRTDQSNGDRWWSTSWHPLKGPDGSIVGINVVAEEITERKRAEAALVASEARYRDLTRTLEQRVEAQARERDRTWKVSQDLLVVADSNGKYLSVNPAWTAVLGWFESELLGKTSEWMIHPDDLERTNRQVATLVAGGKTLHFENRLLHRSGTYRWLSWTGVSDRGQIYAAGRDITELRYAQDELRRSREEVARVNRQTTMAAMTASIAHEINQPLSAIITHGSAGLRWLARAQPDLDETRKALNRVIEDAHRTGEVIASVRSMFGKNHREKSPLRVNDLICDVLSLVNGEVENQQVVVQLELDKRVPDVLGDRTQLQQVLLNLFNNAIEAMSPVIDRPRKMSVTSEFDDSSGVIISVSDSGQGLDPQNIDRIFDPFFTTKTHGMGMGLSICRSIVEEHQGRLWATPSVPHGCIFSMTLPASERANL